MNKTVYMVSLGCPKNLVDSEVMLGQLEQAGYESTPTPETADLLLVNTCGFIGSAVEEAIDEILALVKPVVDKRHGFYAVLALKEQALVNSVFNIP